LKRQIPASTASTQLVHETPGSRRVDDRRPVRAARAIPRLRLLLSCFISSPCRLMVSLRLSPLRASLPVIASQVCAKRHNRVRAFVPQRELSRVLVQ
jgi:hypothetical protein